MNDHYGSIIHEDRMAEFRRDAHVSSRAAEARSQRARRQLTQLRVPALATALFALGLAFGLIVAF